MRISLAFLSKRSSSSRHSGQSLMERKTNSFPQRSQLAMPMSINPPLRAREPIPTWLDTDAEAPETATSSKRASLRARGHRVRS